jgi:hypothetical protein
MRNQFGLVVGGVLFDGLDDVDQVGWPDFVVRGGQCCGMNPFG